MSKKKFLRAVRLMSLLLIRNTHEGSLGYQMTRKAADLTRFLS